MTALLLAFLLSVNPLHTQTTVVYIVTTYGAEVYHKSLKCGALKRPLREGHVRAVSLDEAVKMYRRPCLRCYKKR